MEESGFLNVFKPPEMTSHDVVAYLRKRLGVKKFGHGGTLDPLACGVLVCLINDATKLSSKFSSCEKTYIAQAMFGVKTDSGDLDGNVIEQQQVKIMKEDVEKVLDGFRGDIKQIPPMVSALKVGGKRLYKIARNGEEIEREPRSVFIRKLELMSFMDDGKQPRAVFEIQCSGGTYIRTLVEDIGSAAGVPAVMSFLSRTAVGPFRIEDSVTIKTIISDVVMAGRLLLPPNYLESA